MDLKIVVSLSINGAKSNVIRLVSLHYSMWPLEPRICDLFSLG